MEGRCSCIALGAAARLPAGGAGGEGPAVGAPREPSPPARRRGRRPGGRRSRLGRFLAEERGGAIGYSAAAFVVMMLSTAALVADHTWLVDQRDLLQAASDASAVAAAMELALIPDTTSDAEAKRRITAVAERYARANVVGNAPRADLTADEVSVTVSEIDRDAGTLRISVDADTGGTLFSRYLINLGGYEGPERFAAATGAVREHAQVEVMLAIDMSYSMHLGLDGKSAPGAYKRINIVKEAAKELVKTLELDPDKPVAVGLVPWHNTVRLPSAERTRWRTNGWAEYRSRVTYPHPWIGSSPSDAVTQDLPADEDAVYKPDGTIFPGYEDYEDYKWIGCLGERSHTASGEPGHKPVLPSAAALPIWYFAPGPGFVYSLTPGPTGANDLQSYYTGSPDQTLLHSGGRYNNNSTYR